MSVALRRRRFVGQLGAAATVAAAAAVVPCRARAAVPPTATAMLQTERTQVGATVRLSLVVQQVGRGPTITLLMPSALEGNFEVASTARAQRPTVVAGVRAVEHTTTLEILALRSGEFELGFSIEVQGETIASNAPVLTVAPAPVGVDAADTGGPTEAKGEIFVWATTDKTVAYVGEQVTYALDIYERRQFLNVQLRKPPSFSDFFSEELPQGEPEVKQVAGVPYRVVPGIRRALFPQRAGVLSIGRAELRVGFRSRLESVQLAVEVLPLPAEGQPKGFSPNNVGVYEIETAVDRTRVAPGEPFTLTVTIRGDGNVKFIDPGPWPQIEGVRRYEPKVDTRMRAGAVVRGERVYEFLMVPNRPGSLTIPAHTLAYFDPDAAGYAEARSEAISIEVVGAPVAVEADASGEDALVVDEARLAKVIGGDAVPEHPPRSRWLTTTRWVYGMLAVPVLAVAGVGGSALQRRFGPDEKARARARDKMRRQLRIRAAEQSVDSGDGFHGTVSKLLHELAVRRAGVDGVGLPRPELLRLLQARGASDEDLDELRALLDACDVARFATSVGSSRDRRELLNRALELVRKSSISKEGPP